jgi:hypothetical protein
MPKNNTSPNMCFILHPVCDNCKAPDLKRARLFAECDHYVARDKDYLPALHREHRASGQPAPDATWAMEGPNTWVNFEDFRWVVWPPRLCLRYARITTSVELCQDCAKLFEEVNARLLPSDAIGLTIEAPDATTLQLFGDAAHAGLRTDKMAETSEVKIKREPGK